MILFLHGCHNLYFRRNHVADSICDYFAEPRRRLYFDYFALSCRRCIVGIWFELCWTILDVLLRFREVLQESLT